MTGARGRSADAFVSFVAEVASPGAVGVAKDAEGLVLLWIAGMRGSEQMEVV
jgi:hypothetical protein